jgi:ankyrin repeat protein
VCTYWIRHAYVINYLFSSKEVQILLINYSNYNEKENLQWISWFYQNQFSPNLKLCVREKDQKHVMRLAIESNHSILIDWLIKKDPSIMLEKDSNNYSLFQYAAMEDNVSLVMPYIDLVKTNSDFITLLTKLNCPKMLELLFSQGINLNEITNSFHQTLLHTASESNQLNNVICLFQNSANINAVDKSLRTPLMLAVTNGHCEIANYLITNKAHTNLVNVSKETLLHLAVSSGLIEILKDLLK